MTFEARFAQHSLRLRGRVAVITPIKRKICPVRRQCSASDQPPMWQGAKIAVATEQGLSSAMSRDADSMGTRTQAPRLTRASQPALDQAASLRAAAPDHSPSKTAAPGGVNSDGLSNSNLLSCFREDALRREGSMRYITDVKKTPIRALLCL